ncbi:hypothetical protein [Sphingomonas pituitosa]|uniref:hypothetical protein n=1 Tax=Sphingomonas pituitosa TaxID=99597 RepID=UPI0009FD0ACB|nr:hypothetical protein [Sphingomonas pituitosa]
MTRKATTKFAPEARARAVHMALEHGKDHPSRWAAVVPIAAEIGCSGQALNQWRRGVEVGSACRAMARKG